MNVDINNSYQGRVVDIYDSIVSVSGLSSAFSGELVRFQNHFGDIAGLVLNLEDNVCKVPLIGGYQSDLSIGDPVFSKNILVNTRCGFVLLVFFYVNH